MVKSLVFNQWPSKKQPDNQQPTQSARKRYFRKLVFQKVAINYSKLVFSFYICFMSKTTQVLLRYGVHDIFEYYSSTHVKKGVTQHSTVFFRVCLRKSIATREPFVSRHYFRLHSTEKGIAKLSWVPLQTIFCLGCSKAQSKYKI